MRVIPFCSGFSYRFIRISFARSCRAFARHVFIFQPRDAGVVAFARTGREFHSFQRRETRVDPSARNVAYGARRFRQFKGRIDKGFSAAKRAVEQIANLKLRSPHLGCCGAIAYASGGAMGKRDIIVKDTHRALWYEDGVLVKTLKAGR